MHDDQLLVDARIAATLVADQFPRWRGLDVAPVRAGGTVNAIFRIGSHLVARFPLRPSDAGAAATRLRLEADRAAEFARCSPFPSPEPVATGSPGRGYPMPWLVQTWLPGRVATPTSVAGSVAFADDLAVLIDAMRGWPTRGRAFDGRGRGGDLHAHDEWVATCFDRSRDLLDVPRLRRLWAGLRDLPLEGADVMSHRDLIPANVLVEGEHLVGVLDTGDFGPADRSLDLVAAWHLLDAGPRARLRTSLACSALEWRRGAAWAFEQAMGLPWYYAESNPAAAALGRRTLQRLLADGIV